MNMKHSHYTHESQCLEFGATATALTQWQSIQNCAKPSRPPASDQTSPQQHGTYP